jgi:hypothetical protein
MTLDLRVPIGMMFGLAGAMLAAYGIFGDQTIYGASLGINVNLWWGLVMMGFGGAMLGTAWLSARKPPAA